MSFDLTFVKNHLNIEDAMYDETALVSLNTYLTELIEVATDVTERYLNLSFAATYGDGSTYTLDDLPSAVRHAMLMTIATLYANRESEQEKASQYLQTYDRLLSAYKVYTVG